MTTGLFHLPQQPGDAGTTLVELLVGIVMSAVVGSMAILFMISMLDGARNAQGANEQAASARVVMQSWSMLMRLAVSDSASPSTARFISITPDKVRFCSALNTKNGASPSTDLPPRGIELKLDTGRLVELRWNTCAAMNLDPNSASPSVSRILAPRAARLPNAWLVTPYRATDLLPSAGTMSSGLIPSTLISGTLPLTPEKLLEVAGVQLAFQMLPDPLRPVPVGTYSTVTTLPIGG